MGRKIKEIEQLNRQYALPPLRQYWQQINRYERELDAQKRAERKARDKRRKKCRCQAYPWPHRPGGGFCRAPDSPIACWLPRPRRRPYRERYAGILRQIARNNNLHPIGDRAVIARIRRAVLCGAKDLKRNNPQIKYRNIQIKEADISRAALTGYTQTAGPRM